MAAIGLSSETQCTPYDSRRVELMPHTDLWMSGDRFGTVVKYGRKYLHVRMDRSQRVIKLKSGSYRVL